VNSVACPAPRRLARFTLASVPGNERAAIARVSESVAGLELPAGRMDRLKTAVAEATMNAIEHGNDNRPDLAVDIEVVLRGAEIIVDITDRGGRGDTGQPGTGQPGTGQLGTDDPAELAGEVPDLARKLSGDQEPGGWGLFLIRHMVDGMEVTTSGERRTVRLTMRTQ
jgi:anti-sigma regulatory factor (Ser/Thr protein kinase)